MSLRIRKMVTATNHIAQNQIVIEDETANAYTFQSYTSTIATYNANDKTLVIYSDWDYSKTTMRYFKQFINDYTLGYRYETKEKFLKMALAHEKITFK